MKKFTLPISPKYVAHWGVWEALREIIQNAYDQRTLDPETKVDIRYEGGILYIETNKGKLTPATLILGNSSKDGDDRLRGKFGEGYKLALLVLARLGHELFIGNQDELWEPKIERSEEFDTDVLNIYVSESNLSTPGVRFVIGQISPNKWEELKQNIHAISDTDTILDDATEKGRLYVGGLYVATVKGYQRGYALAPGTIKLDRDRGTVDNFDLSYTTSRLWANRSDSTEAYELIVAKAPDVAHVDSHAAMEFNRKIHHKFSQMYGPSVPVTTQREVEKAQAAGMKWVLVPEAIRKAIGAVVRIFIPSSEPPVERLKKFLAENRWSLNEQAKQELEDIIKVMDVNNPSATLATA